MQNNAAIDEIRWQAEECDCVLNSFEYFLDEYVWIEDKATNQPIKLTLWPDQRKVLPIFFNDLLIIILKAHQLGYTWLFVAAYALYLSITKSLHQVVINSFNEDAGKEIMDRVNFIRYRLPDWLLPKIGTDNSLYLEFLHTDEHGAPAPSIIQVIPATEKGGQGKTPNVMIFDESCWNRYVSTAYNGSLPGITQAKGQIIIISNALKTAPGWPFTRSIYTGSMNGQNDFTRVFLPWWANPGRSRKIVSGMIDGKGQPMTEFKLAMFRSGGKDGGQMDEEDFKQRYPETEDEAISIFGGSYFGTTLKRHTKTCKGITGNLYIGKTNVLAIDDLKKALKNAQDSESGIRFVPDERGILEVWRFPYYLVDGWNGDHWARRYCGGSDVGEGLGKTFSVNYVMDRLLDEFACRLRSNRIDAHRWADLLYVLSEWYCNTTAWTRTGGVRKTKSILCVERTGAGQTTVKRLKDLGANQYVRLIETKIGAEFTKQYGWSETNQAKHDLSEDLRTWFRVMKGTLYDAILIDEASTWIQHEGNRTLGPEEGHFGDCVIGAGCMVQASHFMGRSPERIKAPDTGWMARQIEKNKEKTGWTV